MSKLLAAILSALIVGPLTALTVYVLIEPASQDALHACRQELASARDGLRDIVLENQVLRKATRDPAAESELYESPIKPEPEAPFDTFLVDLTSFVDLLTEIVKEMSEEPKPLRSPEYVTAQQLADGYTANEIAADQRWKGKPVCVEGIVEEVGTALFGYPYVVLGGGSRKVQCVFDETSLAALATLNKGTTIAVYGKCGGLTLGLVVVTEAQLALGP
jgi:hypothetical protein